MRVGNVTVDWVERVLHDAGTIDRTTRVARADVAPIGTGQVADSVRIVLDHVGGTGPASLVAKVSSDDDQSRAAGASELNYLREVRFYQEVAPHLAARVAACHHAEIDDDGAEFALLLEDLGPARPGDQLVGCTVDETEQVLREAARFHAPFWGGATLRGSAWLDISATYWPRFESLLPQWFAGFVERYADRLPAEDLAYAGEFVAAVSSYYEQLRSAPPTVQHGDLRPDNVLFDVQGVPGTVAVIDWQTVILGPAAVDTAVRREHEDRLLDLYHAELVALGVEDYDRARLEHDYAVGTFANLVIGVAAAMLVKRTDRGDELFCGMVRSAVTHARDRDGLAALGVVPAAGDVGAVSRA